jgi:hypothetical protein
MRCPRASGAADRRNVPVVRSGTRVRRRRRPVSTSIRPPRASGPWQAAHPRTFHAIHPRAASAGDVGVHAGKAGAGVDVVRSRTARSRSSPASPAAASDSRAPRSRKAATTSVRSAQVASPRWPNGIIAVPPTPFVIDVRMSSIDATPLPVDVHLSTERRKSRGEGVEIARPPPRRRRVRRGAGAALADIRRVAAQFVRVDGVGAPPVACARRGSAAKSTPHAVTRHMLRS